MRVFKTKQGRKVESHTITKENYEKYATPRQAYRIATNEGSAPIAVCPICDNPIRIFGLEKEIVRNNADGTKTYVRPYAKHYEHNTPIAKYVKSNYLNCPFASGYRTPNRNERAKEITELNKEIYYSVRENFDSAIYILSLSIGIKIGFKQAEELLKHYLFEKGYMYNGATYGNIPWMILYESFLDMSLFGKQISKDSELFEWLKKRKDVELIPSDNPKYCIVKNKDGCFIDYMVELYRHKRFVDTEDELKEYITLRVVYSNNGNKDYVAEDIETIQMDLNWYERLLFSSKRIRNQKLMDIAQNMMPELE